MAFCYRCEVVLAKAGSGDTSVGACLRCGAFACKSDGERDTKALDFICGMCDSSRLLSSAGLPPPSGPVGPPGPSGGSSPGTRGPGPGSGGGGGAAYASTEDFERRRPTIAEQSARYRGAYHDLIEDLVVTLQTLRDNETALALEQVDLGVGEGEVRTAAKELSEQIHGAAQTGVLDKPLLADAFGVAAWSIGVESGEEPSVFQLAHLGDIRLRLVVGRFVPIH